MGFRFSLSAVLRLREIVEQREERLLAQIHVQIAQCRAELMATDRAIVAAHQGREASLEARMVGTDLHAAYLTLRALNERRVFVADQLAQFEHLREKQIRVYQTAHRARELLSSMRQQQHSAFVDGQARQEQKLLDETFSMRWHRS